MCKVFIVLDVRYGIESKYPSIVFLSIVIFFHFLMEMFLVPILCCFTRVCSHVDDFNNRNKILTSKLQKQGYLNSVRYFSKFHY